MVVGWNIFVVHSEQLDGRMGVPWDGMMVFCDLDGFKSGDDVHQTAMVW